MSSDIAFPEIGAQRMPQQLCPAERYAPSSVETLPIIGRASGAQGRMQACVSSGARLPSTRDICETAATAASTRFGSGNTCPGANSPAASSSGVTYWEPPMPQTYTSPLGRGYSSRCVPKRSSSPQKSANGSTALGATLAPACGGCSARSSAEGRKTTEVDFTPVIGTGIRSHSAAHADHGPMQTTKCVQGTSSPSTSTATTRSSASPSSQGSVRTPWTLPIRSSAPFATAASTNFSHSSRGATCALPSLSM
mmetsp:Transcript_5200/g.13560  ORF Transcript_5200/g.13560 Transcript_5200/m.13560 type:complete len:252 (-) Transcript_5200:414-1169(-)